jgi:hypothetical protein
MLSTERTSFTNAAAAFVCAVALSCSSEPERANNDPTVKHGHHLDGSNRNQYRVKYPGVVGSDVALRARKAAEILLDEPLIDGEFQNSWLQALGEDTALEVWQGRPSASHPKLWVMYDVQKDSLTVQNSDLEGGVIPERGTEVTEPEARLVLPRVIDQLEQSGLIRASEYDFKDLRVSTMEHGAARGDQEAIPQILNYRFRAARILEGLPLQASYIRVAIGQSGRLASIRLVGAAVQLEPRGSSAIVVSQADCSARFNRDYPNAYVNSLQFAYALSADGSGIAQPMCVVSFSNLTPQPEGPPVVARRQELRYSLSDASAEPVLLPAHDVVPGDSRPVSQ